MKTLPFIFALLLVAAPAFAQPRRPTPQGQLDRVLAAGDRASKTGAGEDFCWQVAYYLGDFVKAYQAWKDPAWLDAGVKAYDYAIRKMTPGTDGFKGWVGPYGYADKISADVHVGDAILTNDMLAFAELVLADESLRKTYGEAAQRYVELAKKDFVEKWVARGTWREDGPYGAFVQWDTFCPIGDPKTWQKLPPTDANFVGLTLPFNKQNDAGQCLMKLYRITGDRGYRDRAQKIFAFMKSRMVLVEDYYVWNYWEAFGPWDVNLEKKDTRHWMNVHPYRNYQAGEVTQIVEAYHTGIAFEQQDIARILNTNLKVMWNQDQARPKFANSNSRLPQNELTPEQKQAREAEIAQNTYAKEGRAGCLWSALAPFDQTVRDLTAKQLKADDPINQAYFAEVTLKTPPGFQRLYAKLPATPCDRPWSACPTITVAAVMPQTITRGQPSIVLCKANRDTDLEVAVYSADGKTRLNVLSHGQVAGGTDGHAGIHIVEWDGTTGIVAPQPPLAPGRYRVRWTTPDGDRDFPVVIAP